MRGYQSKLGTFIPKDDLKPIHSSKFLEELKLKGLYDLILMPSNAHHKCPNTAHVAFVVYKHLMGFKTYSEALRYASNQPGLFEKMGYYKEYPPSKGKVKYFRRDILTYEGEKQLLDAVEQFRYNNNYHVTDSFLGYQPVKTEKKISFTAREKREIVRASLKYITKFSNEDLKKNCTYNTKTIFDSIAYFLSDASTANGFSSSYRDEPSIGKKLRQKAPTGRTILNRLRRIFKKREDVEIFFDFILKRMIVFVKQRMPEAFNRRAIDLAFDYTMVPTHEDMEKFSQQRIHPKKFKRTIYSDPSHIISDSHIKGKGTINFRKFLCCSIVINGFRFCICYLPVTMKNNSKQSMLLNKMINKIKSYINSNWIRRIYLDREFDRLHTHIVLRKRGINYFMAKIRHKGELTRKINAVEDDLAIFNHTVSKTIKLNIIVAKTKPKNKIFDEKDGFVDEEGKRKFAFCTNLAVTKNNAKELLEGYRSRWSIETMFKDKNKFYGKTTSNDSIIRDFYFAYTLTLFNLWVFCNIVMFYMRCKEPDEPEIWITTFRNYLKGTEFKPPPDDDSALV